MRITQIKYIFLQIKKEYTNMKRTLWFLFFLLNSLFYLYADSENDSLLKVLDKVISERLIYTQKKEATIKELKKKKVGLNSLEDIYNLNKEIIHQYETFVCDSAEQYIHENIDIAKIIGNKNIFWKSSFGWLLSILYQVCLFKLMIFLSRLGVPIYPIILKLCIAGIVYVIMKILLNTRTMYDSLMSI